MTGAAAPCGERAGSRGSPRVLRRRGRRSPRGPALPRRSRGSAWGDGARASAQGTRMRGGCRAAGPRCASTTHPRRRWWRGNRRARRSPRRGGRPETGLRPGGGRRTCAEATRETAPWGLLPKASALPPSCPGPALRDDAVEVEHGTLLIWRTELGPVADRLETAEAVGRVAYPGELALPPRGRWPRRHGRQVPWEAGSLPVACTTCSRVSLEDHLRSRTRLSSCSTVELGLLKNGLCALHGPMVGGSGRL
jgi:hypothetical protein